jgi:hypothetical protein
MNRIIKSLGAAMMALAVAAPAAPAATASAVTGPCAARSFSTIFSAFGDTALYTLVPGGDLEAGAAGWALSAGAKVAPGSSSIKLGARLGARSLELSAGATATTPAICVERGYPSFRFVARSLVAGRGSLRVEVIYGPDRKVKDTGTYAPSIGWAPSPVLKLQEGLFDVRAGSSGEVRFRFTASGGTVRVDDVYVDPRLRR